MRRVLSYSEETIPGGAAIRAYAPARTILSEAARVNFSTGLVRNKDELFESITLPGEEGSFLMVTWGAQPYYRI